MNALFALLFALIAATGNALFALGQRRATGSANGLVFVAASAIIAALLALLSAPFFGPLELSGFFRTNGRNLAIAGGGLYITYMGFNLLFSRFGVSPYVLYAVLSILTTTVIVGMIYLHEPVNTYKIFAMLLAVLSIIVYSLGSARS